MAGGTDGIIKGAAGDPVIGNLLPHLKLELGLRVPPVFFLPGDPARVELFGEQSANFRRLSANREFACACGTFGGREFGVCSTGIGGGSTEIAVVELFRLGARILVRTGGCGALKADIAVGEAVLNSACVRWGGSSSFYAPPEYPAAADPFALAALAQACDRSGLRRHVGIGASIDSYYQGQGRSASPAGEAPEATARLERLTRLGVLNIDMESETLFTVGSVLGARTANILVVHGNRASGDWLADYLPAQRSMVKAALESLAGLYALLG